MKKSRKTQRTYRVLPGGLLRITIDGKATDYSIGFYPLPDLSEFIVEFAKVKGRTDEWPYHVHVRSVNGLIDVSCDCWAGIFHRYCKHASAVRALSGLPATAYTVEPADPFEDIGDLEPVYDVAGELAKLDEEVLGELRGKVAAMAEAVEVAVKMKGMLTIELEACAVS